MKKTKAQNQYNKDGFHRVLRGSPPQRPLKLARSVPAIVEMFATWDYADQQCYLSAWFLHTCRFLQTAEQYLCVTSGIQSI